MSRKPYTPRPYQVRALSHLLDAPRCALWAGMGMGKTVSALTAIKAREVMGESRPTLVLAPLRVARNVWPEEAAKWEHLRGLDVVSVTGSEAERLAALKRQAPVYAMNYDNVPWLVEHFGPSWPFATVIADEATRLKSFRLRQGGKRAQALARVAHTHVKQWVNLTGTPSPNGLADLWGQSWFLDAGARLGRTFGAFTQRWFRPTQDGFGVAPLPFAREQIQERLRDVCLTLDAKDYFDLKEPIKNTIYVELPSKARQLYRQMEREMFLEISGSEVEAFNAAAKSMKCLQLANGAIYTDEDGAWQEVHDAKLAALESVVEEAGGAPVLVAYQFKSDLARLMKAFPKGRVLDKDSQTLRDWDAGKIPVLFAHPASAGHGLNLQDGGNILCFFSSWWDLEQHQQIIERIGPVRQAQAGHERPVFIHHIVARGTVDELVLVRLETKRGVQDLLMQAMKEAA